MGNSFSCTAGKSFIAIDQNGNAYICSNFMQSKNKANKLGNIYSEITLRPDFFSCKKSFCICPQHKYDQKLYANTLQAGTYPKTDIPYDAWFHWSITEECFFACEYCEAGSRPFIRKQIPSINIPALMNTLEKTKCTVHLSFTGGGEPFSVPNIAKACTEITKKHYISFNSNMVGLDMEEFLHVIDPGKLLHIMGSLHLKELERTKNINQFVKNYHACQRKNVAVNIVAVGYPGIIPEISRYKKMFRDKGIEFTFAPFSGFYAGKRYPEAYTNRDLMAMEMSQNLASTYKIEK